MACEPMMPFLNTGGIEKAQVYVTGACGMDGDIGAAIAERQAKRIWLCPGVSDVKLQVITVGVERPVWPAMSGMALARLMSEVSAACGSWSCFVTSAS
jgi:hypothetical protein